MDWVWLGLPIDMGIGCLLPGEWQPSPSVALAIGAILLGLAFLAMGLRP